MGGCCRESRPLEKMPGWRERITNLLYDLLRFFRKPSLLDEETVLHRSSICAVCPKRNDKWCTSCGCWLPLKTKVATAQCPNSWWPTDDGFHKMRFKVLRFDAETFDSLAGSTWTIVLGKAQMKVTFNADHTIRPGGRMATTWWHVMGGTLQIYTSTGKLFATLTLMDDGGWAGKTKRSTPIMMEK